MKARTGRLIRLAQLAVTVFALSGLGWAVYRCVVYVRTAPRFEVRKLSVSGLKHVRENEVLAKAGFEVGTNVFRIRLDEMRERVEELAWVRYALVERMLPDQIVIKIVERESVGLARIAGEVYEFDAEGKVLEPDVVSGASFPILDGLEAVDSRRNSHKVEIYQKIIDDLGKAALSEIHINDADEVTVVSANDPMTVNLGAADFRSRWIKYLQLKPQIQEQYPRAVRVDLRFKNQVIVRMRDDDGGEQIAWGEKKNTL
jgi:cell division septal protein FtsQ